MILAISATGSSASLFVRSVDLELPDCNHGRGVDWASTRCASATLNRPSSAVAASARFPTWRS